MPKEIQAEVKRLMVREEIKVILGKRYSPERHHVMIHSVEPFGDTTVVMFIVETSAYYHRRVAVIVDGQINNDMIAEQR